MFPPIQCSKSSYFTQWLISEYLNRINETTGGGGEGPPGSAAVGTSPSSSSLSSASSSSSPSSTSSKLPCSSHGNEDNITAAPPLVSPSPPPVVASLPPPHRRPSSNNSPTPPPTQHHHHQHHHHHHHHHHFTARHLKHLFSTNPKHHHHHNHNHHSSSNNKSNNNEYKSSNGVLPREHHHNHHLHHHHHSHHQHSSSGVSPSSESSMSSPKNVEFIQFLALNALEFTAPIYSFINKKEQSSVAEQPQQQQQQTSQDQVPVQQQQQQQQQKNSNHGNLQLNLHQTGGLVTKKPEEPAAATAVSKSSAKCPSTRSFVQLSGHPGSFAPAGPNTVWKKMPEDQGGASCGRQQEGSGIGTSRTLRELLEDLNLIGESPESRRDSIQQSLLLTTLSSSPSSNSELETAPVTVFFNDVTNNNPSSSASPPPTPPHPDGHPPTPPLLLPPQIFNIPTSMLPNETQVYRKVNSAHPPDPLTRIIPKYVTETCYNSQMFLELEDLLTNFSQPHPTIMDIKLGTRTFLESEVRNSKPRPDLYQKLISVDPTACTAQEHAAQAVTKLTYMLFREKQSSSNSLGFRVEGVKIGENGVYCSGSQLPVNFKFLRDEAQICDVFTSFCKGKTTLLSEFLNRLETIRETLEMSEFFMTHEVIGCSLLFIHDDEHVGVWLIDFAKTFRGEGRVTHRDEWVMGNREDGVLTGVDNIVRLFRRIMGG